MNRHRRQKGLTLVELLVSMTMGAMLLAGMSQMLVNLRQTERLQDSLFRIQESGRFALSLLTEDIQQAGYLGCATARADNSPYPLISGWDAGSDYSLAVVGLSDTDDGWSGNSADTPSLPEFDAATGSDILRILGIGNPLVSDDSEGRVLDVYAGSQYQLQVSDMDVNEGDLILVSSCSHSLMMTLCEVSDSGSGYLFDLGGGCNSDLPSAEVFQSLTGAQVNRVDSQVYYIGYRGNDTANPKSLFVRVSANPAQAGTAMELVEGVAGMELLYGVDTNADSVVEDYVSADAVNDWSLVYSVRVNLLTESLRDNLLVTPQDIIFADRSLASQDRKLRRSFSTTVALRNRVL